MNGFQSAGTERPGMVAARALTWCIDDCTRHSASTTAGTSAGLSTAPGRTNGASRSPTAASRPRRPSQPEAAAVCAAT